MVFLETLLGNRFRLGLKKSMNDEIINNIVDGNIKNQIIIYRSGGADVDNNNVLKSFFFRKKKCFISLLSTILLALKILYASFFVKVWKSNCIMFVRYGLISNGSYIKLVSI